MRVPSLVLVLIAASLSGCQQAERTETVSAATAATPRSFPDRVTLDNGHVRLEVSAAVGRAVFFGAPGGRNLLWIAPADAETTPGINGQRYDKIGGDQLWPAAQPLWKAATGNDSWPPDGVIDGSPWELVVADHERIVIRSRESAAYGLVVTREFSLEEDGPGALIRNTLLRTTANPFPVTAWTVTQVPMPETAVLDAAGDRPEGTAVARPLTDQTDGKVQGRLAVVGGSEAGAVAWDQSGPLHAKMGSFGRWVAAVYPDVTFLQRMAYDPAGGYLEASSVQVYRGDPYLELELQSPLAQLAPGEELHSEVRWELLPAGSDSAERVLMRLDAAGDARSADRE